MKKILNIMSLSFAALLLVQGCKTEKIEYTEYGSEDGSEPGYLVLNAFNLSVANYSEEITSSPAANAEVSANSSTLSVGTKADTGFGSTTEAGDDYVLRIRNVKTSEETEMTYGEMKALEDQKLPLTPGTYIISAESAGYESYVSDGTAAVWDTPVYYGEVTKTVVTRQETEVTDLVCHLANIKATVSVSPDLQNLFMPDEECETQQKEKLSVTLAVGESSLVYGRTEMGDGKAGYFKASEGGTTIDIVLKGQYNKAAADAEPDYIDINWKASLNNCRAGEWRKISIGVANANEGNVQFEINVENWTYDETVEVDVMTMYASALEETIPDVDVSDENSPVFALSGGNISNGYTLSASMYDEALGKWLENMKLTLTPVGGAEVSKVEMEVSSDNEELTEAVAAAGFRNGRIPVYPADASISPYVLISEANGVVTFTVNDSGMSRLFSYKGTHTFRLIATDNMYRTSYTDFKVTCTEGEIVTSGPEITWTNTDGSVTYDFGNVYPIDDDLEVVLTVSTATAFTGFNVEIISDLLTPEELAGIGLSDKFDLMNPGAYQGTLEGFGFPVGDAISSESEVKFNISKTLIGLIPLLGDGYCNFKLIVTDASGTTEKTVQLTANN